MTGWDIEAWQLSILVTAAIVLLEAAVNAVLRRRRDFVLHKRFRTGALGLLVVLTVIVFVAALGPTLADELSSVAAAVAAVVALWLTFRSYQSSRDTDLSGTGDPHQPPPTAPWGTPPPAPPTVPAQPLPPQPLSPPPGAHPLPSPPETGPPAGTPAGGGAPPGSPPPARPSPAPSRERSPVPGMRLRRLLLGRKSERRR